jgi:N-acetylneuraminic acid mutarotase
MALVVAEGRLHAVGGRFGASNEPTDLHDIFDPGTNSWTSGVPLPTARSGLAYTLYRNLILVLGGELAPNTFAQNEAYDPKTKTWRALAPMPAGRHGTAAASAAGNVYLAAGSLKPGAGAVTDQLIVFSLP